MRADDNYITSHPSCKVTAASFFASEEMYHFSCQTLVLMVTVNGIGASSVEGAVDVSALLQLR